MKQPNAGIGREMRWCLLTALVAGGLPAGAALVYDNFATPFSSGFANGGNVPDYNYQNPVGWQNSSPSLVLPGLQVTDVRVSVNISGGYNGDLYGYLRHDDGVRPVGFIVLLNRPGAPASTYGYGNAGFGPDISSNPFVFSDGGAFDIETYQDHGPIYNSGHLTGTWKPGGGSVTFGGVGGAFTGLNASGKWTLFFQDFATGDQSQVVSWGLQIEAVPEPVTWALILFVAVLGAGKAGHYWRMRRRLMTS